MPTIKEKKLPIATQAACLEFDVCSVGKRCFELSENDYDDFKTVLDLIEKKMYRKRNED